MFIKNFKKTKCTYGCELFNDNSSYLYWENRKPTDDEIEITIYLKKFYNNKSLNILHIGVGCSYIAQNLNSLKIIDGISISNNEIFFAKKLNLSNYHCSFLNKLSKNAFNKFKVKKYDFIIDVNLKSYSCCVNAFNKMFDDYTQMLNRNGCIISGKKGMEWSRILKPVYSFSFKKFVYKRLKEYDGLESNKLSINDCIAIANKNGLKFEEIAGTNIIKFSKF